MYSGVYISENDGRGKMKGEEKKGKKGKGEEKKGVNKGPPLKMIFFCF